MAHELGQAKNFSSCQSVERGAAAWEEKIDIKLAAEAKKSKYFSKNFGATKTNYTWALKIMLFHSHRGNDSL